jgi:cytidylate kinase
MRLITISREYGAGGGELAARLARALGWELLDHELLHRAAQLEHLPDAELEALDEQAVSLSDRFRIHPMHERYIHGLSEAARQAALQGKVILVGRGTRQLVGGSSESLHLRLVAHRDWRVRRMAAIEGLDPDEAAARCLAVDRARERFTRYFFGASAWSPCEYDLVVNTGRVSLDQVVELVADLVREHSKSGEPAGAISGRILTLSRELGAGESGFAPTLADRLGLRCYDRALLEQEAVRLGVLEIEAEKIDENPAGIFERFRPGSIHRRYFEVLGQLMNELAARGDVLLVGRGGSCFLRDHPHAFHVRLVASMPIRLRRVMEYRWLAEAPARKLIAESDDRRQRFYQDYFEVDWSDPLEYDLTVNSGRLGPTAVDIVALAAERFWDRTDRV